MKETQKVVKKISREQKSADGGGASGGGVRTGTKTQLQVQIPWLIWN